MKKEFAVHMLNAAGKEKALAIGHTFSACLADLDGLCPAGREMALVRTKLEEACFFAKKAMASEPENHEHERGGVDAEGGQL